MTLAVAVSCPTCVGVTTTVTLRELPAAMSAHVHETTPALSVHVPPLLGDEETHVVFAGTLKVRIGLVAFELLPFTAVTKYETLPAPTTRGSGLSVSVRESSMLALTVVFCDAVSLALTLSG